MFGFIKKSLNKTKEVIKSVVGSEKKEKISKELIDEALLEADMDYELVEKVIGNLPDEVTKEKLKKELLWIFDTPNNEIKIDDKPFVFLNYRSKWSW